MKVIVLQLKTITTLAEKFYKFFYIKYTTPIHLVVYNY